MNALRPEPSTSRRILHAAPSLVREPEVGWSAPDLRALAPPDTLAEARAQRDELARLLRGEREAAADFLLALADFDHRRGWEPLGHSGLFAFLTRELGLSKGGAFFRLTAARLVLRHPEVLPPLRDGRLCITSVVELARVATAENLAGVLPRFFGCSSREAREVAAALLPRLNPPRRALVTALPAVAGKASTTAAVAAAVGLKIDPAPEVVAQVQSTEPLPRRAAPPPRAEVEPLTADLRRLHVTVSGRLLEKLSAARDGLSHARPNATTEEVLEAALDSLLERQARARALVRRPRAARAASVAGWGAGSTAGSAPGKPGAAPGARPPDASSRYVPAAVEREVRLRDDDRCQYPLDGGGVCGATWQVELDHVRPLTLGGATTADNLRCLCTHNRLAARHALGPVVAGLRGRRR